MLELKNLHSGYNGLEVLKGVSISLKKKEIVALIGPNGAGKSTVIKSIFGLTNITGGHIVFDKKSLIGMKSYELIKEGICYVNQGRTVFGNLTIKENLEIGTKHHKDYEEVKKLLEKVYEKFPVLKEREKDYASVLSGGQQQMLVLGRVLMQKSKILLLDEPSLGLSPILQKEIFSTIKKLRDEEGLSVLIVEQNARKAIEIADRTYLLEDGKIVLEGSGRKFLNNKKIKQVYLGGRY
ncbi:MAG: ABC transporter ATP-binding protein [Nanoarchaeota archaeon]